MMPSASFTSQTNYKNMILEIGELCIIFRFFQNLHRPGETMRQTAERALFECVGDKLKIQFLGNAPWAFYNHVYSKSVQEKKGVAGEKVFIFKAFHLSGEVELKTSKDYQWLLREELKTSKLSRQEKRALFRILYNEK